MKPLGLNLKDAKKVSSDAHSSTFQMGQGHQIRILHAPLSAIHRKQIEKMPVYKMAEGGDIEPNPMPNQSPDDVPATNQGTPPDPNLVDENGNPPLRVSGKGRSDEQIIADQNSAIDASREPAGNQIPAQMGPTVPDLPDSGASGLPNITIGGAYQTGQAANKAGYEAESELGRNQVQAAQNYQNTLLNDQEKWETERQSKEKEIQSAIDDIKNNHIDPKHYLENMSVPGKIASAIGLILGGAGAHSTNGQNAPLQFLNSQIDRDVNAQKANQDNRATVFGAYLHKYNNAMAAENMTRAVNSGLYAARLQEAAGSVAEPVAKAKLLQNAAALQNQMIPLINNANLIQQGSKFSGVNGQPAGPGGTEAEYVSYLNAAQRLNPELYKDAQSKYVPGVGVATHPVVKEDQERLENLSSLAPLVDKAIADQTKYGMTGAWSAKNVADAKSDHDALQVSLNKLTGLNRLNDREYQNYGQQIGNIGGLNRGGTLETLKNLKRQLETDRNTAHSNMGLVPFRGAHDPTGLSPEQTQNLQTYMKRNPGVSQGAAIKRLRDNGYL